MVRIKRFVSFFAALLVLAAPVPWNVLPARAMTSAPVVRKTTEEHLLNPHLHGAKPIRPGASVRKGEHHHARYWVGRWAYGSWVGLHRGYGAITGNVQTGGKALPGAEVMLIGSGRRHVTRHITRTNVSGGFIMMRVRPGTYHVKAIMGERTGQAKTRLWSGTIISVHIFI
jgi:hypothetical protein